MIPQYGEGFLQGGQIPLCNRGVMPGGAHLLDLRHLFRKGALGLGDVGVGFGQPL